jgi:hypothetical protein
MDMIRGGATVIARRARLVAALYAVQAAIALIMTFAVERVLASLYATRPLFDRGVHGDLASLIEAILPHRHVILSLVWFGVALALVYGVASWFLTAGLLGALRSPPPATRRDGAEQFGMAGAAGFAPFARLWLWSIIPYVVAIIVTIVGFGIGSKDFEDALTMGQAIGRPLGGATLGLVLLAIVSCSVDYARVLLVGGSTPSSGRALLRGAKIVFTQAPAFAHFLTYLVAWGAVTAIYVAATIGRPFAGVGGALGIFVIRQIVSAARFTARVTAYAGQQVLVGEHERT